MKESKLTYQQKVTAHDGAKLKAIPEKPVDGNVCSGCYFEGEECVDLRLHQPIFECSVDEREDGQGIIWVRTEAEMTTQTLTTEHLSQIRKEFEEVTALKEQLAESRKDYRRMVTNYQTLIIDLAPYLAPDQIHMVGGRTGNWFYAMEDGKYLVRHDPRDSEAGLWENTKPTSPNS